VARASGLPLHADVVTQPADGSYGVTGGAVYATAGLKVISSGND
jgi:hypothetical protein